jgi:hypothetical protein
MNGSDRLMKIIWTGSTIQLFLARWVPLPAIWVVVLLSKKLRRGLCSCQRIRMHREELLPVKIKGRRSKLSSICKNFKIHMLELYHTTDKKIMKR